MAISAATKSLLTELADGVWASSESAERESPATLEIDEADGWGLAYEQHGTGRRPERVVFNELLWRVTSALADVLAQGVPSWDERVDYSAAAVTAAGEFLWIATVATGPTAGNPTDPTAENQTIWRRF